MGQTRERNSLDKGLVQQSDEKVIETCVCDTIYKTSKRKEDEGLGG